MCGELPWLIGGLLALFTATPGFAANLEQERQKIAADIDRLRFCPAVKIGVLYRF